MHNAPFWPSGMAAGQGISREDPAVWKTIDYAASNIYDYQDYFHDPDGFDARLGALRDGLRRQAIPRGGVVRQQRSVISRALTVSPSRWASSTTKC